MWIHTEKFFLELAIGIKLVIGVRREGQVFFRVNQSLRQGTHIQTWPIENGEYKGYYKHHIN